MSILSTISRLVNNTQVISNGWRGFSNGSYYFGMGIDGTDLFLKDDHASLMRIFEKCGPVSSIVTRKSEMFVNGDVWILDRDGANKAKESETIAGNKLRSLINRPNPLQKSWSLFEAQAISYYQIWGWVLILPIHPVGFEKSEDITQLWVIPNFLVDIEETKSIWYANDSINNIKIILRYGNERTTLNLNNLYLITDFTPNSDSVIFPASRLLSIGEPITAIMRGFLSIKNGMRNTPLGILGNDTKDSMSFIPLDPGEKALIEQELRSKGLGDTQQSIIVSNANLRWNPISYPIDSLKLPDHIKLSIESICDRLGFYYELLSNSEGTTFSNKREALKGTYQDFVIPMAKSFYEQLNIYLNTEASNLVIDKDFSRLPILQEDAKSRAEARKIGNEAYRIEFENDLITVNRWLELNGEDTRGNDGDIYYSDWIRIHPELLQRRGTTQTEINV